MKLHLPEQGGRMMRTGWTWYKKSLMAGSIAICLGANFLYMTALGMKLGTLIAELAVRTDHAGAAWLFIGKDGAEALVRELRIRQQEESPNRTGNEGELMNVPLRVWNRQDADSMPVKR
jgi:hypothetical protein